MTKAVSSKSDQVSIRIDKGLLHELERIGKAQAVPATRNAVINAALREYVERNAATGKPKGGK
jgi:metal-responsive CopG/Arc/MetJ family transcriptional regulator